MPTLALAEARRRFADAPVARLATTDADGSPHLVPVVFAVATDHGPDAGGDTVLMAVDAKPKRHRRLRRLANIAARPEVSLLVDHYEPDWSRLWWVRADGLAAVHDDPEVLARARAALALRYPQHRETPPEGPAVTVRVHRWSGWAATAAAGG